MRLEESDGSAVALESCDLAFELLVEGQCFVNRVRRARDRRRRGLHRCRSGLRHKNESKQANE